MFNRFLFIQKLKKYIAIGLVFGISLCGTYKLTNGNSIIAKAESVATPNYEVKIYMDPSIVLNSDNDLKDNIKDNFSVADILKINVCYLDSTNLDLNNAGWDVRLRKIEGKNNFQFDYKKRFPVSNGNIDEALQTAAINNFDFSDTNYEAQIDWNYTQQTLSFSNTKDQKISGYDGMDLPSTKDSINYAVKNLPGKLEKDVPNAKSILNNAHIYGPVAGKRYTGTWDGQDLDIEVYNIAGQYIVEDSFKVDDFDTAQTEHDKLISYLQDKGWLLTDDVLKTQLILNNY